MLDVVANVLARQKKPFLDDEEERLAMIVLRVSQNLNQATGSINRFFNETDIIRWTDYTEHSHNNEAYYRVSSWKRLMMTLYFMAPSMQSTLLPLVTKYFSEDGLSRLGYGFVPSAPELACPPPLPVVSYD
ncbi:MAG: DUF2785 domain-containing protein [Lacticaseibacillus paracasei]|nr:DUF2785 domain-containing protein [Lacticaseibacillus paracasei]